MKQLVLKRLFDLHSFTGIAFGLVLYVVFFSGAISLFLHEMEPWEQGFYSSVQQSIPPSSANPEVSASPEKLPQAKIHTDWPLVEKLVADFYDQQAQEMPADSLVVFLPSNIQPYIQLHYHADNSQETLYFNAISGKSIDQRRSDIVYLFEKLHTDLLLPAPFGRYLIGFLGCVMLVSICSGVLLHRKLLKQMFVIRFSRSRRLLWSDLHKTIGIWALPFLLMMAMTGAYLGLVEVTLPTNALSVYGGDIEQAMADFVEETPAPKHDGLQQSLDLLVTKALNGLPKLQAERIAFIDYGTASSAVRVYGSIDGELIFLPSVLVHANSGQVLEVSNWREATWVKAVYGMFTPLHYGSFGGLPLKLIYTVFSLLSCALVVFGTHIWLERNAKTHTRLVNHLRRSSNGIFLGVPAASVVVLLVSRLSDDSLKSFDSMVILFVGVLLGFLLLAYQIRSGRFVSLGLIFVGTGLLLVPCLGGLLGLVQFNLFNLSPAIAVDITFASIGLILLGAVYLLSQRQGVAGD